MLLPNNKQRTKLFEASGVARWAYNWALVRQKENYDSGGKFIQDGNLRKELTLLKRTDQFNWLNNYSNNITKQSIKDACVAYKNFFNKQANFPKFKSKKKSDNKFYVDNCVIEFSKTHVKLEKLIDSKKQNKQKFNWIKLAEKDRIPINTKYINPRVSYDGIHWWISVGIEYKTNQNIPISDDGIGIDLGIKDLAICSDGNIYKNINKTIRIKKIDKKKRKVQRQISKKYLKNKKGNSYCKTSNIIKDEKKLLAIHHRLRNIRHNYIHQTTSEIINRKPMFVVLEDLNVNGMMKNKHLAKAVQEQCFYEFYRQMKYKSDWNNIKFIEADRFYPSSRLCSACGCVNSKLKLSDRIYVCPECGNKIDRDYQASVNLKNYGYSYLRINKSIA
jgi:putative transposase